MATQLKFIVCANGETIGNHGEFCDEATAAWSREAIRALESLAFVSEAREDSHFPNWNGGKYAHQAKMHGFERFGLAVCIGGVEEVEVEQEGDTFTTDQWVTWLELAEADRREFEKQIWAALEKADKARDDAQADEETQRANDAAQQAADAAHDSEQD